MRTFAARLWRALCSIGIGWGVQAPFGLLYSKIFYGGITWWTLTFANTSFGWLVQWAGLFVGALIYHRCFIAIRDWYLKKAGKDFLHVGEVHDFGNSMGRRLIERVLTYFPNARFSQRVWLAIESAIMALSPVPGPTLAVLYVRKHNGGNTGFCSQDWRIFLWCFFVISFKWELEANSAVRAFLWLLHLFGVRV